MPFWVNFPRENRVLWCKNGTEKKRIFGSTLNGFTGLSLQGIFMKIPFHLVYRLRKSVRNWGQESHLNLSKQVMFSGDILSAESSYGGAWIA